MTGLFKWTGRKEREPAVQAPAAAPASAETVTTSKVLPKVLSAMSPISTPELMDLGPVVGQNIAFFGEQLACKIHVEDLYSEIEGHARRGASEALAAAFDKRLQRPAASVDGVLCWDIFDYLDRRTGQALAARLVSLVKPGGIIYGFFGQAPGELRHYTRYIVDAPDTFRLRTSPATLTRRTVLVTRDVNKMFEGLLVAESVLLKSSARETLFRKP